MKRTPFGTYIESSTLGETVRAFVPPPIPPEIFFPMGGVRRSSPASSVNPRTGSEAHAPAMRPPCRLHEPTWTHVLRISSSTCINQLTRL